ncbi:MAG TPA: ribbon-helix-helix protein, CopG family [Nitrospiraceae bacterium]
MKRISIMLSLPQVTALKAKAQSLGITFSELVRRVLDAYLEQK